VGRSRRERGGLGRGGKWLGQPASAPGRQAVGRGRRRRECLTGETGRPRGPVESEGVPGKRDSFKRCLSFLQKFQIKYEWKGMEIRNNFSYRNFSRFEV
jgi:hypothetical protein